MTDGRQLGSRARCRVVARTVQCEDTGGCAWPRLAAPPTVRATRQPAGAKDFRLLEDKVSPSLPLDSFSRPTGNATRA
jgi:hypothetical protein